MMRYGLLHRLAVSFRRCSCLSTKRSLQQTSSPPLLSDTGRFKLLEQAQQPRRCFTPFIAKHSKLAVSPSQGDFFEEENLSSYEVEDFYPLHIGEILHDRYKVVGKLGYGTTSTTWLCYDLKQKRYVCLKLYIASTHKVNWEVMIYRYLESIHEPHPGQKYIRSVLDDFEIQQRNGSRHYCLVHPPLLMTLWDWLKAYDREGRLSVEELRGVMKVLFQALDFLHAEANIAHCDVKASNLLFTIKDQSILEEYEAAERRNPSLRKVINDQRTIYGSRGFNLPKREQCGHLVLCDFGEARIGKSHKFEEILPPLLRPPEILLQRDWGHAVDIWCAGCMIWDVFENKRLFNGHTAEGRYEEKIHLAEMVAYLGSPSLVFEQRSPVAHLVFNEDGSWKGPPSLPNIDLAQSEDRLGGKEKTAFLEFVLSMLRWRPKERVKAHHLLQNPWLNGKT